MDTRLPEVRAGMLKCAVAIGMPLMHMFVRRVFERCQAKGGESERQLYIILFYSKYLCQIR